MRLGRVGRAVAMATLALAVLSACEPSSGSEATAKTAVPTVPVETQTLTSATFVETVEVSGVAEPIHEIHVAAEAAGRVTSAPFEEGARVEEGDLLLRVDAQLDSARIDLLENQLATARREFERTKMLAREGLATPQQLDQASSSVDSAQLSIKQARVGIGKTTVRSPQTGIVAEKFIEEGEYVAPGAPLAHIVDYDTIIIETAVPESDIAFVSEGSTVQVWLPGLEKHVDGVVKRRAIVATPKTRTFPVEVHVTNASHEILPGMRARVIIPRKTWKDVVVVPRDAILQGYESKEAMVLPGSGAEGPAELRKVELGPARGNEIVVTAGLAPGDRLIVKGHRSIVNGTRVKSVREVQAEPKGAEPAPNDKAAAAKPAEPATAEAATN